MEKFFFPKWFFFLVKIKITQIYFWEQTLILKNLNFQTFPK